MMSQQHVIYIDLVLTSSITGRNACPSEEVTFTCTAQGTTLFWGNEEFGEKTMQYTSAPSTLRDEFRAEIVSYDRNQNCLVSSLRFRATASRNGTTVNHFHCTLCQVSAKYFPGAAECLCAVSACVRGGLKDQIAHTLFWSKYNND